MKVREYLRQPDVHWVNHFPGGNLEQECLVTAVHKCYYICKDSEAEYEHILSVLEAFLQVYSLINWNDDPNRTLQEVLTLVDAVDI